MSFSMENNRLAFLSGNVVKFISPEEVMYCISDKNYTDITITTGDKVVTNKSLKELEEILGNSDFVRIHNSFIANVKFVSSFKAGHDNELEMMDGKKLIVSRRKKASFLSKFQKL